MTRIPVPVMILFASEPSSEHKYDEASWDQRPLRLITSRMRSLRIIRAQSGIRILIQRYKYPLQVPVPPPCSVPLTVGNLEHGKISNRMVDSGTPQTASLLPSPRIPVSRSGMSYGKSNSMAWEAPAAMIWLQTRVLFALPVAHTYAAMRAA